MMLSSSTILITDGEHRAALAATRSLGRAGFGVVVASSRGRSLAGASRYAAYHLRTPDPLRQPDGFLATIRDGVVRFGVRVVLPIADESIAPLLRERHTLGNAIIPFPSSGTWSRVSDKRMVLEVADRLGIATPRQAILTGLPLAGSLDGLEYPLVLKPSRSLVTDSDGLRKLSVFHASDPQSLERILRGLPRGAWPVLAQQRIVGPGMGVFLLLAGGEPLAAFAHRRLLEKPPSGGVSACSESVSLAPTLRRRSVSLLQALEWEGVAMVEYKLDSSSGVPYLMEVNGRLWGSLQLAIDAGVDFPRLLVAHALGQPVAPVLSWEAGIRSRWRLGEVDHLIARLGQFAGREAPPGAPSLLQAFRHAFLPAWGRREKGEVLRIHDPWPAAVELADWLRGR